MARDDVALAIAILDALANLCADEMLLDYQWLLRRELRRAGVDVERVLGDAAATDGQKSAIEVAGLPLAKVKVSQLGFLDEQNLILLQHTIEAIMARHPTNTNLALVGSRVLGMLCSRKGS